MTSRNTKNAIEKLQGLLIRVDRVQTYSPTWWYVQQDGDVADLALTRDGQVIYSEVQRFGNTWVGTLAEVGSPGTVPGGFLFLQSIGWFQSRDRQARICMSLNLAGKRRLMRFTGIVPSADSTLMKLAGHIPHHVGFLVHSAKFFSKLPGSGDRAEEAAAFWRAVLSGDLPLADAQDLLRDA